MVKQWLAEEDGGKKVQSGRVERRGVLTLSKRESSPFEVVLQDRRPGMRWEVEGFPKIAGFSRR